MYEIYKKNWLWPGNNRIIKKNLMFKIIGNIELRVSNFGYVMAVDVTIMYINFSNKSMGFIKSYSTTRLILVQIT